MTEPATVMDRRAVAIDWPAEVDFDMLRATHGDLADKDDAAMAFHWETYGRNEGRLASLAALRENFIGLVPAEARVLEVGPFTDPMFEGPNVHYFDVLDGDALRAWGRELGRDVGRVPQVIHYTPSLDQARGADFDIIFSCHNIEHHPDLIGHLQQAGEAVAPGCVYMLVIPDRRFCFDHFLPDLDLASVVGAHVEKRALHTAKSVIEHRAFTCHNDTLRHWQGDHGPAPDGLDGRIEYALNEIETAAGGYIDVHAWQFTPDAFRRVLGGLHTLGLSPFRPLRVYSTPYGRNEFMAVLVREPKA
jgi:SAM-dependent methyltransferase